MFCYHLQCQKKLSKVKEMYLKIFRHHTQTEVPSRQSHTRLSYYRRIPCLKNTYRTCPFPGFSRGMSKETTDPYFWHSSFMSSMMSAAIRDTKITFLNCKKALNLSTLSCADVPSYSSSLFRWLSSIRLISRRTGEGNRTSSSMWGATRDRGTAGH